MMDQNLSEVMNRTNGEGERIRWIDGLRGIGCICILLHHFFLTYYPATYYGSDAEIRMSWSLDARLADLPFFFLLNGNFWVCVYLVISGFVMAGKNTENLKENRAVWYMKSAVRRYLTLVLPIFIAEMCVFAENQVWPDIILPDCCEALPFSQYLASTFLKSLFTCDKSVIGALWTMQAIFLGGLIILLAKLLIRNRILLSAVLIVLIFVFKQPYDCWYFIPVFVGALMGLWYPFLKEHRSAFLSMILLPVGAYLASYPSGVLPNKYFSWLPLGMAAYWHLLGAVLCIYTVGTLGWLQKLFSVKIMLWLGTISYSVYIFHIVVIKGTLVLCTWLANYISSYSAMMGIVLIFSVAVVLLIAAFYQHFIDARWRRFCKAILK